MKTLQDIEQQDADRKLRLGTVQQQIEADDARAKELHDNRNRIQELEAALRIIRNKVHSHNRGGELYPGLREVIRAICDQALATGHKK